MADDASIRKRCQPTISHFGDSIVCECGDSIISNPGESIVCDLVIRSHVSVIIRPLVTVLIRSCLSVAIRSFVTLAIRYFCVLVNISNKRLFCVWLRFSFVPGALRVSSKLRDEKTLCVVHFPPVSSAPTSLTSTTKHRNASRQHKPVLAQRYEHHGSVSPSIRTLPLNPTEPCSGLRCLSARS